MDIPGVLAIPADPPSPCLLSDEIMFPIRTEKQKIELLKVPLSTALDSLLPPFNS